MAAYALAKGIPEEDIIIENKSRNTLENMEYSKEIIQLNVDGKYKAIYATNNYHVFRAGLYAKKVGLKARGLGAKTAAYFWFNAVLREYIAIIFI